MNDTEEDRFSTNEWRVEVSPYMAWIRVTALSNLAPAENLLKNIKVFIHNKVISQNLHPKHNF